MSNRLYRSPTDRVIGGVAGGLAVWMNIDPSLVRIAWVLLAVFTGGIFLLVYFVMMLVVPLPPAGWVPPQPSPSGGQPGWQPPQGGGAQPGWQPPSGAAPGGASGAWQAASTPSAPSTPSTSPINSGNAGIVAGAVLIVVGAWFLLDQYISIDWALLWPVVVIVLGIVLIAGALRRGRSGG